MHCLNRTLLARQHLLERADLSLTAMVEAMGGVQMQYAPSGYIGLWTRLARFERDNLTHALEARQVIQATLMRSTIHLVSARDYWPMVAGLRRSRREWYERISARERGGVAIERAGDAVRSILADGPLRQKEIEGRLAARGLPPRAMAWAHVAVDLVRVPPSGTWQRRRADLYALAEQWLPATEPTSEVDGLRLLLKRYLDAFGPAPIHDFANWAGVPISRARGATDGLSLVRYRDESGRELVDLADQRLTPEDVPVPVRFLPTWDAVLLVHARRTGILPEAYRPRIFSIKQPQSIGTFLVDGRIAGTWRWDAKTAQLATETFEPLDRRQRTEVEGESRALAAFHRD